MFAYLIRILNTSNYYLSIYHNFCILVKIENNPTGTGYEFLADVIIKLNAINPQIAAGLSKQFNLVLEELGIHNLREHY